jgi:hypothetical protein
MSLRRQTTKHGKFALNDFVVSVELANFSSAFLLTGYLPPPLNRYLPSLLKRTRR